MDRDTQLREARRLGEQWAEEKAEILADSIPAIDWPEVWRREWDGELPADWQGSSETRAALREEAHHAASDRWPRIVRARRKLESLPEEQQEAERAAQDLLEAVRGNLPTGVSAGRDGPRVYLLNVETGEERTVRTLEDAWRETEWWREHPH